MLNLFKGIYSITLIIISAVALIFISNANATSNLSYEACAQSAFVDYQLEVRLDPLKAQKEICKLFDAEPGQDCNDAVRVNQELGFFDKIISRFIIEKIIEPKCGPYKRR